ncbi:winged helix-turn-helix transcriptional regulator [Lentzea sp. NEAU-D7]|uniref:winged helix-turn-helix transcriptional regulator n=1 Tax=Lentzea sp. NEAU-D7 TaxID=2994667 RepID=UPI00224B7A9A|nr:helix-turn-helix domain-containing protein [Lentzea sp. NEAU-D7]MCX2950239.1 helix-turn-helix domain-containing protein [Lentzea sp. NEAU-D7]
MSVAFAGVGHQTVTWDRPSAQCPVEVALAAISGRWATLVLRDLMHGPRSFSALRAGLPSLSAKVLTERLESLVAQGLVSCSRSPGFPVRTSYELTSAGLLLRPLLVELYRTGEALLGELPDD